MWRQICVLLSLIPLFVVGVQFNPTNRILHGDIAPIIPHQFHVQAFETDAETNLLDYGAGQLITPKCVLTVGRLIKGFELWSLGHNSTTYQGLTRILSIVAFLHPNYAVLGKTSINDIGIIVLPRAVDVQPVHMPILDVQLPRAFEEGQVTNFETTNDLGPPNNPLLKMAFLTAFPNNNCEDLYPNLLPEQFCAYDDHLSSQVCTGDLGTGFYITFRGSQVLAGITTTISDNCQLEHALFTRIQPYYSWISAVTMLNIN